ncbi:MAG TPA: ABC transporter substrate-binding protein [Candidatus Pullichristensenella stercoripullorum]|nr:ABC transporter substrate-binding protein [Candidatus Pullichristensenella stercoripullorum]
MKKILAILLALTLVLSVGVAAMAEEETELWGEGLKIGLAQMHYTNAFRIAETESVISAFEAVGAEVVWNEAGNDTATQVANAKDLLAQDIDYLLLPPKEEAGLVPALDAAKEAGVPVILLDRSANGEPGVDYVTAIRSDAIAEGEWCAQWIIDNYPDGANIVEVFGAPGSTTAMDRAEGFWNLLAEAGDQYVKLDSQVGDNMRDTAQKVTENMIQAHGSDIDIIVTHSDEMTFGALQAIEGMGYVAGEDFKVLSIGDGASALLEAIIDGRVAACSECSPLLGPQAVEVVKTLEEGGTVEGLIWANDRFFTIENAAEELEKAGW